MLLQLWYDFKTIITSQTETQEKQYEKNTTRLLKITPCDTRPNKLY